MMDRLRNRDLRTNNNKCYTMYFDDDQNKDITNKTTMPTKKGKSRSPRKKEPIKNCNSQNQLTNENENEHETKSTINSEGDTLSTSTMVHDIKNNDAIAVDTETIQHPIELNADNALDFSATNDEHNVDTTKQLTKCNGSDNNASNDKNMSAHEKPNERNERKRRLSQACSDRNEDIDPDDEDDDDQNSNEIETVAYNGKKAKIESSKMKMYQAYQPWVIKTYGDLAKTKTITIKKHQRILKALNGLEQNNPDSSKFRFWVKAKGFTIEKPHNFKEVPVFESTLIDAIDTNSDSSNVSNVTTAGPSQQQRSQSFPKNSNESITTHLFVPNLTKEIGIQPYRKVAVVEQFFDIIYNVHVGLGGRSGRHAGQKRTYRTITESYAFLPRDAVTKFLAGCHVCKKSPRACSPSRLDETYCTESSSEMDILNYSPKSMSDMSVGSSAEQQRISTPLSNCTDTMASLTSTITSAAMKIDANSNDIERKEQKSIIDMETKPPATLEKASIDMAPTLKLLTSTQIPQLGAGVSTAGLSSQDAVYVDEFYQKISEYYRGIFSNIDIKDPNISADVLNYYQLIRQFYEQTMAINIQRNTAMGIASVSDPTKIEPTNNILNPIVSQQQTNNVPILTTPPNSNADVSHFDLNIQKPPLNDSLTFNSIKTNSQFQNNINIATQNIETDVVSSAKENLIKMNDAARTDDVAENKVTIISAGVSINVSSLNSNSLKISCKTTPPKKRYSVYNHTEDAAPIEQRTTPNLMLTTPINLNRKFDSELVTTAAKRKRTNNDRSTGDENPLTKSNFAVDALRSANVNAFDSNKSSPMTNIETSSSITDIIPITSTYLQLMRSMGFTEEDALKFDNLEPITTLNDSQTENQQVEDTYAGLMKDADKLKLMLLAWNYQNSNAVRNGTEAPDLSVVGNLWAQYQNALVSGGVKLPTASPSQSEQPLNSPNIENPDESSSSGQKEDDDGSEDDSDDRLDQNSHDPERLKAFNMFVRLFVDENLDRMIPISKQPKEKIQAIIDSCTRQFPEFSERARKRIRTYLKSCRRNKKTREGWEPTASRPTPAHLTSVQAEQILAMACENESLNAKRMRIGLDPISQTAPLVNSNDATGSSINYPLGFKTEPDAMQPNAISTPPKTGNISNTTDTKPLLHGVTPNLTNGNGLNNNQLFRQDMNSPPFPSRPQPYQNFFTNTSTPNVMASSSPTDLSMKQSTIPLQMPPQSLGSGQPLPMQANTQIPIGPGQVPNIPLQVNSQLQNAQNHQGTISMQQQQQQQQQQQPIPPQQGQPQQRLPILTHKLNAAELNAVRQLVTGYRESANFLLRSADELETLLQNQN